MPATLEEFAVLALLIAPGFVFWRLVGASVPRVFISQAHTVLTALLWSLFIHTLLSPYSLVMASRIAGQWQALQQLVAVPSVSIDWAVVVWLVLVIYVVSAALAWIISLVWQASWAQPILENFGLSLVQNTPTAWDWFFLSQSTGCWVIAEMKDGSRVGGEFGTSSFTSVSPHGSDLYLEAEYEVDQN